MIDIAHAKQEFEKYLDEYDRQDEQIYLKNRAYLRRGEIRRGDRQTDGVFQGRRGTCRTDRAASRYRTF